MRALEEYPKPVRPTVLIFGIGLGLAIGSRIMAGLGALYVIVPLAMLIASDWREANARTAVANLGRFVARPAAGACSRLRGDGAGLALVRAASRSIRCARSDISRDFFEKPWKEMFDGVPITVPDMPRSYVPVMFALKLPEIFVVLAAGRRRSAASLPRSAPKFRSAAAPR